ncbi:MAG: DUF2911 domain-containing protein [Gemmatimonadaceae bacterium]
MRTVIRLCGRRQRALTFAGAFMVATPLHAQVRASERATVSQTADGTTITLDFARPRARGRNNLFGGVVEWGETWTPGANWATTIQLNRDATLDGHPVPKGKYSVWFVVNPTTWTVVLDPRFQRYHEDRPDSTAQQIRWSLKPTTGEFAEILTWSVPEVRADGMQLLFAWGTMRVSIDARVNPTHPLTIARADAEPFLGSYRWRWEGEKEDAGTLTLYYDDGRMKQRYEPFPTWYRAIQDQPMSRINDAWFIPAILKDGKVWEMDTDLTFEFDVQKGKALSFELRDEKDNLLAKGQRVEK